MLCGRGGGARAGPGPPATDAVPAVLVQCDKTLERAKWLVWACAVSFRVEPTMPGGEPEIGRSDPFEEEYEEEEEGYSLDHLSAVIRPVALTMALAS